MTAGRKRKRSKRYEAHEKKILKISLLPDVISPKSILFTTLKTSYKHNNTFFNSQDLETVQCPNGRLDKVSEPRSSLSKRRWEWGPTIVSDTESYNSPLSGKVRMLYKGVPSRCVSHIVGGKEVWKTVIPARTLTSWTPPLFYQSANCITLWSWAPPMRWD